VLQQTMVWPPQVGDRVGIKGSRLLGTVTAIEGESEEQRFTLDVVAPPDADAGSTYELEQAARVARTTYAIGEIEPRPA
jgi:hypothetical protein